LRPGNATKQEQATVALVVALLRQALELLLPRFESSVNLSEIRLSLVNGAMESLPETLRLLSDVFKILDMQVICVIDGFHWLDDRETDGVIMDLIKVIRQAPVKALFTTTGRTACLKRSVDRTETVQMAQSDRGSDVRLSGGALGL
jgi:hypothetical protein